MNSPYDVIASSASSAAPPKFTEIPDDNHNASVNESPESNNKIDPDEAEWDLAG